MKKMMIMMALSAMMLGGCVDRNEAVAYAARAHPECTNMQAISHSHTEGGSQTEVTMVCGEKRRSITIKCIFGWGVVSDTTCHENN